MLKRPSLRCVSKHIPTIDGLESRRLMSVTFPLRINFQPATAAVPAHCHVDGGALYGLRANGLTYGWNATNVANARDRDSDASPDQRYDTFNHMQRNGDYRWEVTVPNGIYTVHVVAGDADYFDSVFRINVEGIPTVEGTPSNANRWIGGQSTVQVPDGRLTISNGTGARNNKICFVEITPAAPAAAGWSKLNPMPHPRFEGMGSVVDNMLYCFGGYLDAAYHPSTSVDAFDLSKNAWTEKRPMPIGMTQMGTATDGRYIYLAGGYVSDPVKRQLFATSNVWRYDPMSDTYATMQPLPDARGVGSMVYLSGKLFFLGGSDAKRVDKADVFSLDLNKRGAAWTKVTYIPAARNRMGAAVVNGEIYCLGGQTSYDAGAVYHSEVWRLNPNTDVWTTLPSLPAPARSHISAATVVSNGRIFVLGGEAIGQSAVANVDVFNAMTRSWSRGRSLPAPRNYGIAGLIGTQLIFTGGLYGVFRADTWTESPTN
jgi:N-acetylneuraminic acid mutarotase